VRSKNEDACLDRPEREIWAVADGMGGHSLGDVASRIVVDTLSRLPTTADIAQIMSETRERLQKANRQLRDEAEIRGTSIIGSTIVTLLACGSSCGYLWAGDSRMYLFRDGRLQQLTRDHSHLEEFKAQNNLNANDIVVRPPRNAITRAVGAAETLEIDEGTMAVRDGDMFLLCSDGLSNAVNEQEMCNAILLGDCQQSVDALIELALQRGGRDNISVVLVRAEDCYGNDKTVLNPAL
jgi:protein phosphatase